MRLCRLPSFLLWNFLWTKLTLAALWWTVLSFHLQFLRSLNVVLSEIWWSRVMNQHWWTFWRRSIVLASPVLFHLSPQLHTQWLKLNISVSVRLSVLHTATMSKHRSCVTFIFLPEQEATQLTRGALTNTTPSSYRDCLWLLGANICQYSAAFASCSVAASCCGWKWCSEQRKWTETVQLWFRHTTIKLNEERGCTFIWSFRIILTSG